MGYLSVEKDWQGCRVAHREGKGDVPFLAGFYSNDLILEIVSLDSVFFYFISTGLTVCYSFCLIHYSLCSHFNLTTQK